MPRTQRKKDRRKAPPPARKFAPREAEQIVSAINCGEVDAVVVVEPRLKREQVRALADINVEHDVSEIVRAIRSGEVDAFVVSDGASDRVFTLAEVQQALFASERRFRELADSMPSVVWTASPEGTVEYFNQKWWEFTGFTCIEESVQKARELIHPDDLHRVLEGWRRCLESGEPYEVELRIYDRQHGKHCWHLSRGRPVRDASGAISRWFGTLTDIDVLKTTQQELDAHRHTLEDLVAKKTSELEESHLRMRLGERMAALGTLSAGLGHDMSNLILPIQSRLDSLQQADLDERAMEDVRAIRECTSYLQRLVGGLRTFAMDPTADSDTQRVDVAQWWNEVYPLMAIVAHNRAELHATVDPNLPSVRVNRAGLTQAVFNLIQNAAAAIGDRKDGRIEVTMRRDEPRSISILVRDNGAGMTEDVKRRCMEPFFSTKTRKLSTGLGLALVHGIVQRAGGSITIESEPGKGACFIIQLPAAAQTAEAGVNVRRPGAHVTIDDPRVGGYIATLVTGLGFEVRDDTSSPATEGDVMLRVVDARTSDLAAEQAFLDADPNRLLIVLGEPESKFRAARMIVVPPDGSTSQIRQAVARAASRILFGFGHDHPALASAREPDLTATS